MKYYRLKNEAIQFFKQDLSTKIESFQFWQAVSVDMNALEEVEECVVKFGIKTSKSGTSLCGWGGDEKGSEYHFTIEFPSMKYKEYDEFNNGRFSRELMNNIQKVLNSTMKEFSDKSNNKSN